ncbi:Nitrogen fixation protein VnfA [Pelotomaculum sp. FP]|uniref:sigma 54-interacting transcriptional regulator n=1 Tax=Pelotomaculum sp. FP TaxID=261474 RepID=UPI001066ADFA|nr:sigma 54-interacting transcriptional regulator [Pelotomaculum sp. FP]TEB14959.1 Nitrogen fixation protein VnfA [Pelotomaculum sp. FP]
MSKINYSRDKMLKLMLSRMLKASNDMVLIIDSRGIVTLVNQKAAKWLGRKKNELAGSRIEELINDIDEIVDALAGKRSLEKEIIVDKTHYLVKFEPIILGRKRNLGGILVCRDISVRKKMEEAYKELDAVLDTSSDSMYITDGEGKTLRINAACNRTTGLEKDVVVGLNVKDIVAKGLFNKSSTLEVLKTKSKVTILQNVTDRVVIVTGTPLFDEQGNIWRVVSSARDITELNRWKNQTEEERRLKDQYYSELVEMRVRQMTRGEGDFIASSAAMQQVVELAMRVARTDSTVLVRGESGVGKEVVTKFIHRNSTRKKSAFMKINCAAIPENLLESELFGYEPGAFTGAMKKGKVGLIELANHGTLFLDEIGEMPLALQAKLLQVIQERTFYRVGGTKAIEVDIRIIAATNRDLEKLVEEKKFREDLFYRLNVIPITIPPLRERKDDIVPLLGCFLDKFNKKHQMDKKISNDAFSYLLRYRWPGNIRELENMVEQLVVITPADLIEPQHLPGYIHNLPNPLNKQDKVTVPGVVSLPEAIEEVEKQLFLSAYENCKNTYQTAKMLGVSQPTVVRKLKKYKQNIG